jgi:hypothetical protein
MNRRQFLAAAASTAAIHAVPAKIDAAPAAPSRRKLREFEYSQVTLTGGPLADHYRRVHRHFLTLDNDRVLKVYRQRAGLPAPGADMGGWYDADGFVPGHLIGQFISGLARLSAHTGDAAAAAKALALLDGYAATLGADNNPYASSKASTTWPCYILDKYEVGLLDAAALLHSDQARALLPRVISGAQQFIPDHTYDRDANSPKQAPYDEPYILSENLFRVHELLGDERYLKLARLYLLDSYFDPLARGRNILPGKHGYSHVIALSSAAKAYEVLGDLRYLQAIRNAWDMLEQTQEYASGAWAPKEAFVTPHRGELAASLVSTHEHFETPCGYYAHSKLARYLLGFTADARYGDGLERVLYNTILGAKDPDDNGGCFYYSDYHARATKSYYQRKWPCCAGTLVQSVADYPLNLYFHDDFGIYVNLYAASAVRWESGGVPVTLTQRTGYPESESIAIDVAPDSPAEFSVSVRIPAWIDRPATLTVNGKDVATRRGSFVAIRRRWTKTDTIQLTLPFATRTVPVDDRHPEIMAILRGPLMMSAIDAAEDVSVSAALAGKLLPFYQVKDEVYSTYFRGV